MTIHLTDLVHPEQRKIVETLQRLSDGQPLDVFAWNIENSLRWRAVDTLVRCACAQLITDIFAVHPEGRMVFRLVTTGDWVWQGERIAHGIVEENEIQPIWESQASHLISWLPSSWADGTENAKTFVVSRSVSITDHGRHILSSIDAEWPHSETLFDVYARDVTEVLTHESTEVWRNGVSVNAGTKPEPSVNGLDGFPLPKEAMDILQSIKADTEAIRAGDRAGMEDPADVETPQSWETRRSRNKEAVSDQMMILFRRDESIADLKSSEIAKILGCSDSAVRHRDNVVWRMFQGLKADRKHARKNATPFEPSVDYRDDPEC